MIEALFALPLDVQAMFMRKNVQPGARTTEGEQEGGVGEGVQFAEAAAVR